MPSIVLQIWRGPSAASLEELEAAHRALGGSGPGRRYATQQVNHAYVIEGRKLDTGNPNPGNIGSDFRRIGLNVWPHVDQDDARNAARRRQLEWLNKWRNAIAHQDFDPNVLGGRVATRLEEVRRWRRACNGLAESFDRVLARYLSSIIGSTPW